MRRALALTQNLYQGGAVAIADVQQAQAQLETARTQAEDTRLRRAQTEHAIAVLVGREASDFSIPVRASEKMPPLPTVDAGLPSELLERRPDVAAAERRVAAANAGIGVARAAYFPVFSLVGTGGVQSSSDVQLDQRPEPVLVASGRRPCSRSLTVACTRRSPPRRTPPTMSRSPTTAARS